jgi:hypothetical protein
MRWHHSNRQSISDQTEIYIFKYFNNEMASGANARRAFPEHSIFEFDRS